MARIFLCRASEDKQQVRNVYQRLAAIEGFEPWLDEEDLLPGQDWTREIPRALNASEFILVFFSRNSVAKRGYVQREMKLALDALQELPEGAIRTIPVRLDDCNVPDAFQHYHYANLFDPKGFDRIVRAIRAELAKRPDDTPASLETPPVKPAPAIALPLSFTNAIGMEFVLIPAGSFIMGTPRERLDAIAGDDKDYRNWIEEETPQHRATITKPFYMGKHEVTQAQWQEVMGHNPSYLGQGNSNHPVENVSWDDAQQFIQKLNEREGVTHYRLPTKAEWEYAARAGTTTSYSFGDDPAQLGNYAWYKGNSGNTTHPVGQKNPNPWGLYDMHGNVYEWVHDWYGQYPIEIAIDPQSPLKARLVPDRINRGGSFDHDARGCRSARRGRLTPHSRRANTGFRCLSSVSQ